MIDFVFGPNHSFYAKAYGKTFTHNLPPLLNKLLDTPGQAERIHNVALGEGLTWFAACMNIETGKNGSFFDRLPDKLHAWLYDTDEKGGLRSKRHSPTIKVVFGPGNSFFAHDKNGYSHYGLPDKLVGFLKREIELAGTCCPTMLGIGSHELFFVECNGYGEWNMPVEHPKLKAWVDPKFAQDSGTAKYYTEGRVQHFWIDPFSTPAQLIMQDQNNWIYDIPILGQHAAASNILEEMNQHIRASQITKPTPDLEPEARKQRPLPSNKEQLSSNQKSEALDRVKSKATLEFPIATTPTEPSAEVQAKKELQQKISPKPVPLKDLEKVGTPDFDVQKASPKVAQLPLSHKLAKQTLRQPKDLGLKVSDPVSQSHTRHPSLKIDQPVWKEVNRARGQVVDSKPNQPGHIPGLMGTHQIRDSRHKSDSGIDFETSAVNSLPSSSESAKAKLLTPEQSLKPENPTTWQSLFRSKSSALEHTSKATTHESRPRSTQPSPRRDTAANLASSTTTQEPARPSHPIKQQHLGQERTLEDVHRQIAELKAQTEELTKLAIQLEQNRMREIQTTSETHRQAQVVDGSLTPIATTFANIPDLRSVTPTFTTFDTNKLRGSPIPTSAKPSTSPKPTFLEPTYPSVSPTYQRYNYSPISTSTTTSTSTSAPVPTIETSTFASTNPFRPCPDYHIPNPDSTSTKPFTTDPTPSYKKNTMPFNSYLDAQSYSMTYPRRETDGTQPPPPPPPQEQILTQAERDVWNEMMQDMYRP